MSTLRTIFILLILAVPSHVLAEVRYVPSGGNLQAALDAAQPGDVVELQARSTYVGNFTLPVKPAGAVISVRSSERLLERRVSPEDVTSMATLSSPNGESALRVIGSANWRVETLALTANQGGTGNIVECQGASAITFDRLLIEGGPQGQKRAILCNGTAITLSRSYIQGIYTQGQDSQCFLAYDGPGPYSVLDNFCEAASENVMFGGADPSSIGNIPADILVEGNTFTKPRAWVWKGRALKNLFELKCARRVTVRGNILDGNWSDAQDGHAIQLTPRNQDGRAPFCVVSTVTIEKNIIRSERGVGILGIDGENPSGKATGLVIRNNVFVLDSDFMKVGGEVGTLSVTGNSVYIPQQAGLFLKLYAGDVWPAGKPKRPATYAVSSLTLQRNISTSRDIHGDNVGGGEAALKAFCLKYAVSW